MSNKLPHYNSIGEGYNSRRSADTRILDRLKFLLDQKIGARILDVGAGTGNYTTALVGCGYKMWAIEPSSLMVDAANEAIDINWHIGSAEEMPYESTFFDAAYCTLSVHHFADQDAGLSEILRVLKPGGRLVIFTSDPRRVGPNFWMTEYFGDVFTAAREIFPSMDSFVHKLKVIGYSDIDVDEYFIPSDNQDGFFSSAWQRPSVYLDHKYRDGISSFRLMDANKLNESINRLKADLQSKKWHEKYGDILYADEYDTGYTFVTANKALHRTPTSSAGEL